MNESKVKACNLRDSLVSLNRRKEKLAEKVCKITSPIFKKIEETETRSQPFTSAGRRMASKTSP